MYRHLRAAWDEPAAADPPQWLGTAGRMLVPCGLAVADPVVAGAGTR